MVMSQRHYSRRVKEGPKIEIQKEEGIGERRTINMQVINWTLLNCLVQHLIHDLVVGVTLASKKAT